MQDMECLRSKLYFCSVIKSSAVGSLNKRSPKYVATQPAITYSKLTIETQEQGVE